jgi:hypothetical protein
VRFYQLRTYCEGGNSAGYRWFTTRRDADKAKREDDALDPDEAPGAITVVDIEPTKAGILDALRRYASHPDNG